MLRKIHDFALRNNLMPCQNFELRDIRGHIVLLENGEFVRFEVKEKNDKQKVLCPDIGSMQFGDKTNPMVTKLENILNIDNKKHNYFCEIMQWAGKECESVKPICSFLEKYNTQEEIREKIMSVVKELNLKMGDFYSFTCNGRNIEDQQDDWKEWFYRYVKDLYGVEDKQNEVSKQYYSILTGERVDGLEEIAPLIKSPIMGSGCYVTSYGNESFTSYGLSGNENAQIGQEEALRIKAGLEYLLDETNHHYTRDFNLIHFCDNETNDYIASVLSQQEDDLFDIFESDEIDGNEEETNDVEKSKKSKDKKKKEEKEKVVALAKAYQYPYTRGNLDEEIANDKFQMMTISVPTKGRFYLGNYKCGSIRDLYDNLRTWTTDTELVTCTKDGIQVISSIKNVYSVFWHCLESNDAKDKRKQIDIEFGQNKIKLLYAIVDGMQIPKAIYIKALRKIRKTMIKSQKIYRIPMSVVKCYLIREQRKKGEITIMPELNENETNVAYNCGRLFAIYESVQYRALGKLNASVVDKYFASAGSTPSIVFGRLAKLSNYHLNKMEEERYKIYWSKKIQEVAIKIPNYPKTFSIEEQGMFALGYYHQKYYNCKKTSATNDMDNTNETNENDVVNETINEIV